MLLPDRKNTLGDPPASPRSQVSGLVEVVSDLAVAPSTGPQRQDRVDQLLTIWTQRTNIEIHWSTANDEDLRELSAVTQQLSTNQAYSTVTLLARLRGLSTSVPKARAV